MNMQEFLKNRMQFPPEELLKYAGSYVAWSPDGTAIIASDTDLLRLDEKIRATGHNRADVLISSVPADDVVLGGGGMME
jgi:hypothetical protein